MTEASSESKTNTTKIGGESTKKSQLSQNLKVDKTNLSKLQASTTQGQKIQKQTEQSILNQTNNLKNSQSAG